MMGLPENAAKHALYNTGNNSADMAATWYFENMDNPGISQLIDIFSTFGTSEGEEAEERRSCRRWGSSALGIS